MSKLHLKHNIQIVCSSMVNYRYNNVTINMCFVFLQNFSFISDENWSTRIKSRTCRKSLTKCITKLDNNNKSFITNDQGIVKSREITHKIKIHIASYH
jgi:hypothetical protein